MDEYERSRLYDGIAAVIVVIVGLLAYLAMEM